MFNSMGLSGSAAGEMSPNVFYSIVSVMKTVDDNAKGQLEEFCNTARPLLEQIDQDVRSMAGANNDLVQEIRLTTKFKDVFKRDQDQDFSSFAHSMGNHNCIKVAYDICAIIQSGYHYLLELAENLAPRELLLGEDDLLTSKRSVEVIQKMMYEIQLNRGAVSQFISGIERLDNTNTLIASLASKAEGILENYYKKLSQRHSVEGVEIFRDTIITDVAISIYENVDSHGEIEGGKKANEISAYTQRKAELIAGALKKGLLEEFVREPKAFLEFICNNLKALRDTGKVLQKIYQPQVERVRGVMKAQDSFLKKMSDYDFDDALHSLKDLDPRNVAYKEKTAILTSEERFNLKFRNETLKEVVRLLGDKKATVQEMVKYILERKAELRAYFQDENTFYICKVGGGNAFMGEAPGMLAVVPGVCPRGNLDEIVGSNFDQVKEFISGIEHSSKWHDLFIATSPSGTADKSNVLLVGPPGCGKSEVMRAVAADKKSLSIFAQGSDFLTCWKGEADKNPKRLFEAGLRLQKESKKHVHFLIDEIDSVLNDDKEMGGNNLTLEFQILMDGVVSYPNLSVWGATNNPDRIPMPMIRRFSKVLIVGELSQADRVHLLKHFSGFLPTRDFNDQAWNDSAIRLDGATGDVIRKIADHLWRTKMSWFVNHYAKEAEELVSFLNKGEKFELNAFTDDSKREFRTRLGKFMAVQPADLQQSIDLHLKNMAIRSEIATAKETYASAKRFLEHVNSGQV